MKISADLLKKACAAYVEYDRNEAGKVFDRLVAEYMAKPTRVFWLFKRKTTRLEAEQLAYEDSRYHMMRSLRMRHLPYAYTFSECGVEALEEEIKSESVPMQFIAELFYLGLYPNERILPHR